MYFKTKPMAHQAEILKREKPNDGTCFAYLAEMGTGKSKMLIDDMVQMHCQDKIDGAVVTTYKGVYMNWVNIEIPKHWPDEIPVNVIYWANSKINGEYKRNHFNILVINIELFSRLNNKHEAYKYLDKFFNTGRMLWAIDESTAIKNHKSKRTKAILDLKNKAAARRILTGSPITNSPLDLFTQFYFLDRSILNFKSYYSFKATIAREVDIQMGYRSFKKVVGYNDDAIELLIERIKPYSYRITKDECLDLPPKIYMSYEVQMNEEQKKAYNQMKKYLLSIVDNGTEMGRAITVQNAISQMVKLQQITSGFINDNEKDVIYDIPGPNNKIEALVELLEMVQGKTIIFARFRKDIENIYKALREIYGIESIVRYYGDTSNEEREFAVDAFQNNDDVSLFIANPATAGYGLTLTAASNVIYFSNSFDIEKRQQSEDRAHRIGQKKSVTYIDLICSDTIDEKIVKSLREKKNLQDLILVEGWKAIL